MGWSGAGVIDRSQILRESPWEDLASEPVILCKRQRPVQPLDEHRSLSHPFPSLPALLTGCSDELVLDWESAGTLPFSAASGEGPWPSGLGSCPLSSLRDACFRLEHGGSVRRGQTCQGMEKPN